MQRFVEPVHLISEAIVKGACWIDFAMPFFLSPLSSGVEIFQAEADRGSILRWKLAHSGGEWQWLVGQAG